MDPPGMPTGLNSDINRLLCPSTKILPKTVFVCGYLLALYLFPASIDNVHKTAFAGDIEPDVMHSGHLLLNIRFIIRG